MAEWFENPGRYSAGLDTGFDSDAALQIFAKYKDADSGHIGVDGMMALCTDLGMHRAGPDLLQLVPELPFIHFYYPTLWLNARPVEQRPVFSRLCLLLRGAAAVHNHCG